MKFLKEYWPFIPLILVITAAFLVITIAIIGELYSYQSISNYNVNYQSDHQYNDNSLSF